MFTNSKYNFMKSLCLNLLHCYKQLTLLYNPSRIALINYRKCLYEYMKLVDTKHNERDCGKTMHIPIPIFKSKQCEYCKIYKIKSDTNVKCWKCNKNLHINCF